MSETQPHEQGVEQALEQAMDRIHAALLAANFSEIPKIVSEIDGLVARLGGLSGTASAARLHHKARRNGLCLQAAARGLRAAQRRLTELSDATKALATYSSHGKRSELSTGPGCLTQRL